MISIEEINRSTSELHKPKKDIESLFEIIENPGKGNCLFYSLSQCFSENHSPTEHSRIRKSVCEFYKTFDLNRQYAEDSIEEKIQVMSIGNEEHYKRICKGKEWGTMTDIYAVAVIYKVNIIVFNLFKENPLEYLIIPIQSPGNDKTIYLRYNTLNEEVEHYESMIPKPVNRPNSRSPSPSPSPKTLKRKREPEPEPEPDVEIPIAKKTLKNKGENTDKHNLIGQTVVKIFKTGKGKGKNQEVDNFIGSIVSFNGNHYLVVYEDGDQEELTLNQVNKIILKGGGKKRRNKSRKMKK